MLIQEHVFMFPRRTLNMGGDSEPQQRQATKSSPNLVSGTVAEEAERPVVSDTHRQMAESGIKDSFDPTTPKQIEKRRVNATELFDVRAFVSRAPAAGLVVECRIERDRSGLQGRLFPQYYLYLDNGRRFLLAARRRKKSKSSNYLISLDKSDLARSSGNYVGKVRSNIAGTEFNIYDKGDNPEKVAHSLGAEEGTMVNRQELGLVRYGANILGWKGPRKMAIHVPITRDDGRPVKLSDGDSLDSLVKSGSTDVVSLMNKDPVWSDSSGSFVLNFHGRVTVASVKNFQLVNENRQDEVLVQFGRVDKDIFTLDFKTPLSAIQAFAIALTSFDKKLMCE